MQDNEQKQQLNNNVNMVNSSQPFMGGNNNMMNLSQSPMNEGAGNENLSQPVADGNVAMNNIQEPPKNKKKKWFIIGGIVAAVLAIVAVVAILLVNQNKETYETAFNRYANYILYEKDSTEALSESYDSSEWYTLQDVTYDDTAFFDKSQELFDNFLNLYYQSDAQTDEVNEMIDEQKQIFEFLKQYYATEEIDNLFNIYLVRGAEQAKAYVNDVYNEMKSSSVTYSKEYAEAGINYFEWLVDYYELENRNGCIVNGKELDECNNEEVLNSFNIVDALTMQIVFEKAESTAIKNCWRIERVFNSDVPEVAEEDETNYAEDYLFGERQDETLDETNIEEYEDESYSEEYYEEEYFDEEEYYDEDEEDDYDDTIYEEEEDDEIVFD